MPEFKTTAKDVVAPFVKRTADVVTLATGETVVYFTRGENDKGWIAFAGESLDAIHSKGSTLDGAVNALIFHAEDGVKSESFPAAPAGESVAPAEPVAETAKPVKGEDVAPDTTGDDAAAGESDKGENSAPKMTPAKLSALVMHAYRASADAVTAVLAGKMSREDARKITGKSYADTFDLIAAARTAGMHVDAVTRLGGYADKLISHHDHMIGGRFGSALNRAQKDRARRKFAAVAAHLATL